MKKKIYAKLIRNYKNWKIKSFQDNITDLTGNYKTAFNKGKQQETEYRVKHTVYHDFSK